ncbi:MAG: cation:proton antiporter [Candidatus Hydrogenedentales bacterium]|jgi:CPA2 family monovalent cation:H+ antiporter-2
MHEPDIMAAVVLLFGTALFVAWLFRVIRAPSIIGFLITGLVMGPSGLHLFDPEDVSSIKEIGLVLLLFIVGLELSPRPLFRLGKNLLAATGLQIGVTAVLAAAVLHVCTDYSVATCALIGGLVALSSTAIVLKQISERGETDSVSGTITIGILLLQDVIVIAFMLFLPLLAVKSGSDWHETATRSLIGVGVMALLAIGGRKVLPGLMYELARRGGPELMTLFAVSMACGGAWFASLAGWSPALGACVAGLLLAEADARHQLVADIHPFRDVFNAVFFISLGMIANIHMVAGSLGLILLAVVATLIAKSLITTFAVTISGWPIRPAIQVGLGLCTVSEFGYVVAFEASKLGLMPADLFNGIMVYAIGTMMLGAVMVPISGTVAAWISARVGDRKSSEDEAPVIQEKHHVIIVGFGVSGQNLARVLKATRVHVVLIEMSPRLIQIAKDTQTQYIVGDATRRSILEHAGIATAHAMVIATNDRKATRAIVSVARSMREDLYILARCRFESDLDEIYRLGASQVIPEDFETSIEIAAHVLKEMDIPDNVVEAQLAAVRAGRYGMLRGKPTDRAAQQELMKVLQTTATRTFYLEETHGACGKTIGQLNLRARTGVLIIAVVRNGVPTTNPAVDTQVHAGDVLVLVGAHVQLEAAKNLLQVGDTSDNPSASPT